MADYQVTCITRDQSDADRRIDALGGPQFYDTIDNVIDAILNQGHRFWTHVQGQSVWIEVRRHSQSQRLYLATQNDGFPPNNLLSLPECQ